MRAYFLLLLLLFSYSKNSYGTDTIKVVTEDWPPYNFILDNGQIGGTSTTVVKNVLKKAKINYDISLYPWARSYEIAQRDKNTLIYSILRTPDREKLFKWVCPISGLVGLYLYKLKKRDKLQINSIEQAKQYTTGVTRNDYPHVRLKELGFKDQQLLLSPADKSNIKMLLNERIDFVVESSNTMESVLKQTSYTMDDVVPLIPLYVDKKNTNCMAFNINTDDRIVNKVRQALKEYNQQMQNTATIDPLTSKN